MARLAALSGHTPSSLQWLLQQDMVVPASIYCAAIEIERMAAEPERPARAS